jgi:hypothetical protein
MSVTISGSQFGLVFDVVCDTSATEHKPRETELLSIWPGDVNEVSLPVIICKLEVGVYAV